MVTDWDRVIPRSLLKCEHHELGAAGVLFVRSLSNQQVTVPRTNSQFKMGFVDIKYSCKIIIKY